jgi:hypothetical protein
MGRTIALNKPAKAPPKPRLKPGEELFGEGDCLITCRACGAEEYVFTDHPALLCAGCLADLPGTSQRLAEQYASSMVVFFEAARALGMRARGNAWFEKTERAREDMDISPATFARAWEAARAEGGEKRDLIELREAMDEAALTMRACELLFIAASPELAAARAAFGEPVEV